ncbi:MAG TPA: hypothetical protein VNE21_01975 [Mycobacteriales bacterium]|nr:hypothetical protein [Mycobacteriales bacterium]
MAYLQHGVAVVGAAPMGSGWQDYRPSTLWLSTDLRRWRDVTPTAARQRTRGGDYPIFEQASFLTATTGWVTTWDPAGVGVTVYGTADGGRSWTVVTHGGHSANGGATELIQLLTGQLGFAETLEPTAPGMDVQTTTDGGRSWRTVYAGPPPRQDGQLVGPFEMPMVFLSASRGFSADAIPLADPILLPGEADFFVTSDGGRHWRRESPPMARPRAGCPPSSNSGSTSCLYGLPTFSTPSDGVLPAEVITRTTAAVTFATTTDGGATWTLASTLRVTVPVRAATVGYPARYPLISAAAANTWWVLMAGPSGTTSRVTVDAGHAWSATPDPSAPRSVVAFAALDASHAWLTALVNSAGGSSRAVYVTSDGGRSWQRLRVS